MSNRYATEILAGMDEAGMDSHDLIKREQRRRERDMAQVERAFEIAGQQIAGLKARAEPAKPSGLPSKEFEALRLKIRRAAGVPESCL